MSNRVYIPILNPCNFVQCNRAEVPQYLHRHMDDYLKWERLNPYESMPQGRYAQPWLPADVVSTQIQTNAGAPVLTIIDCTQHVYATYPLTQRQQNQYLPDYFIYESNAALTGLEGIYFPVLDIGSVATFVGEGFRVAAAQPGTLLIEYTNRSYYGDFIFETGITPSLRLQGVLRFKTPASKDTLYEDQVLDMVMVQSRPYRIWELIIIGVPDWMADKINWIMGCSSVRIDGKYFTKNEGAKLEEQDVVGNGFLKTYKIELRESIARGSKIIDTALDSNEELTIVLNTTSKGFADTSEEGSSSIVTFIDVE